MSLTRTALRLATVLALNNNYKSPFPTIAADRVHDSRNVPPSLINDDEFKPEIAVYTTDDDGDDPISKRPPFRNRTIDLIIELSVVKWSYEEQGSEKVLVQDLPTTDPELEAWLDVMEHQVKFALANPISKWASQFGLIVKKINSWKSGRWADEEKTAVPLAYRIIKVNVSIPDDCAPKTAIVDDEPVVISVMPTFVQSLIDAIDADANGGEPDSYVSKIADVLRYAGTPASVTMRPLKGVTLAAEQPDGVNPWVVSIDDLDQQ
jgi:hypothetical protein